MQVESGVQALLSVTRLAPTGDRNHCRFFEVVVGAKPCCQFMTAHPRHSDVQQNHVGSKPDRRLDRRKSIERGFTLVSLCGQHHAKCFRRVFMSSTIRIRRDAESEVTWGSTSADV